MNPKKPETPDNSASVAPVRLQKYLAMAGFGSRRQCEELICSGRVRVKDMGPVKLGVKVVPGKDVVFCDGKRILAEEPLTLLLHKPRNYTCDEDPRRPGKSIASLYPELRRYPVVVGLQRNASGLVLLSNDGELHQAFKRGSGNLRRKFHLRIKDKISQEVLLKLVKGIVLDGVRCPLESVDFLKAEEGVHWYSVLTRGHKEGILDRVFLSVYHPIQRMLQVGIAGVEDSLLPKGRSRQLTAKELSLLRKNAGLA